MISYDDKLALFDLEGARVECITITQLDDEIVIDFRHKGTDDGSARVTFSASSATLIPWNPDVGDFR